MTGWKGDSLFFHKRKPKANKGAFTNLGASNQRQRIKWKYAIKVNMDVQTGLYCFYSHEEMPRDKVIGEIEVSPLDSFLPPLVLEGILTGYCKAEETVHIVKYWNSLPDSPSVFVIGSS